MRDLLWRCDEHRGPDADFPALRGKLSSVRRSLLCCRLPWSALLDWRQGDHANPAGQSRGSRSRSPSRRALRADAGFAQRTINRETPRVGRELEAGEPSRNTSAPQREGHPSPGRSRQRARPARLARRPGREPGTRRRAPRCEPTFAGVVTARPPARAPERDGAGRTTGSSFRSQPQSRSGRSPPSQCLPDPARSASAAAASRLLAAARAHDAPRPPSEHRRGYDRRVRASAERRGRARTRRRAAAPRAATLSRPRPPARAAPRRRSPRPPGPRATDAGTAVDARNSTDVLTRRRIRRWLGRQSAQPTFRLVGRRGEPPRLLPGGSNVAWRIASRAVVPCFQSRCRRGERAIPTGHRLPARCKRHCWRTTSTGALAVSTITGSERFATALPAISYHPFREKTQATTKIGDCDPTG